MNLFARRAIVYAICLLCIDWTRLSGKVKAINLKDQTVTIENHDGDLLTVPIDYQVKMTEKNGDPTDLKKLALDQKIILTRIPSDRPKDETEGLAAPEPGQHGL